jgi:hypothetical protein
MRRSQWAIIALGLIVAAACTPTPGGATALLPDVPNTTVVEGQSITDFIAKLADGASLAAGNPQLILLIEKLQSSLGCLQQIGAVAVRTYTDKTFPLSAGIVAVVDRNAVTNLANLQQCFTGDAGAAAVPTVRPCAQSWTLKRGDNEFYIAYLASTAEMCAAFCSQLEGCPAR